MPTASLEREGLTMRTDWWRLLIAFVAVYVLLEVCNFLVHGLWLASTYTSLAEVWRPPEEVQSKIWIIFVTDAFWLFFFCYVFARGYEGKGLVEGVRYGVIIGFFFVMSQSYNNYVIFPIPYGVALKWFLSGLAGCVVLGIVAAAIYRPART
jgi:hypothetical protein